MGHEKISKEMADLASQVCDLWQEHLANLTKDAAAKSDFVNLIEPQRQLFTTLFADYVSLMQHRPYGSASSPKGDPNAPASWTSTSRTPSRDHTQSLDEFADRLALMETKLARIEAYLERLTHPAPPKNRN